MKQKLEQLMACGMIDQTIKDQVLMIQQWIANQYAIETSKQEPFLTHLVMVLRRVKAQEQVEPMPTMIYEQIIDHPSFALSQDVLKSVAQLLELDFDQNECLYLYLHLNGMLEELTKKVLKPGYTLMHEHMVIDLSRVKADDDTRLHCIEQTIEELKVLSKRGVGNIVDVTLEGMGQDLEALQLIEARTGIRIIHATGYYKEPFLPSLVKTMTVSELASKMCQDLTGPNPANVIGEIGTSHMMVTDDEQKVFDAAILAYKQKPVLITTHTTLGTMGLWQATYLTTHGVLPEHIIIGHQDLNPSSDEVQAILDLGVTIGIDTIGKEGYKTDDERAKLIQCLEKENKLNQVVLSLDITRKSQLETNGGIGYAYLFDVFIPKLKAIGVTDESIHQMLVTNPCRLFGQEVL